MNHLKEYFYTRYPTRVLHLRKILLSIADVSRNIHILRQFYWFSLWVRCAIFQINTNLLISEQNINIFTQETLFLFFILEKWLRFLSESYFEKFIFYHIFTILTVSEICNISNKYRCTKMKFSIKNFFCKCDQIRSFLRTWLHLLKKSLMENFNYLCSVLTS